MMEKETLDFVGEILRIIRAASGIKDSLPQVMVVYGNDLVRRTQSKEYDVRHQIAAIIADELRNGSYSDIITIWWYSVINNIDQDSVVFLEMLKTIRSYKNDFPPETMNFLYQQANRRLFLYPSLDSLETQNELMLLFTDVVEMYKEALSANLLSITGDDRDISTILVISSQILSQQHGPTLTALDRCSTLIKYGKRVLLINSATCLSDVGVIPWYNAHFGNYRDDLLKKDHLEWKGVNIPYFQCDNDMPNLAMINILVEYIRKIRPYYAVSIGGDDILANLINDIIPVVCVGLCPSLIPVTCEKYRTYSGKMGEHENLLLANQGFSENNVIQSVFTSNMRLVSHEVTRKEKEIPDASFFIVVVGGRLDCEVTREFLQMMEDFIAPDFFIGFYGSFENYDVLVSSFPKVSAQSQYFGFANDVIDIMTVADLFVNPKRKGGWNFRSRSVVCGLSCGYDRLWRCGGKRGGRFLRAGL